MHDREIMQVTNIIEKYTSDERMKEMQHNEDTQICESANYMLTGLFAPKDKNFSRTKSFDYRKCHVVCLHNDGHYSFYSDLLLHLGITMNADMHDYLCLLESRKDARRVNKAAFETKKVRAQNFHAKLRSDILQLRTENITYESNHHINKVVNERRRDK